MYTLKKDTEITHGILFDAIKESERRNMRFNRLEAYYFGRQDILERVRTDNTVNNTLVINHAKYITDTNVGYLLGNPVEYQVDVGGVKIDPVVDAYKNQTIADLDAELAKDISIFGVQYEYLYANEDNEPKSANVDNRTALIVYDTTLEHKKLFCIMQRPIFEGNRITPSYYEVIYADKTEVVEYTVTNKKGGDLIETEGTRKPHGFGQVPMIEYKNNSDFTGDFEGVMTLLDAYNLLQSDRLNDKEQLVDAILAFYGAEVTPENLDSLRENRVISGIPADAKAEYITKGMNEADGDTLRKNIEADIHKISMTPNMTDSEFVGNSSGVAIRYKLLAFEQNIKTKERYMERGLMERFAMYWNYLSSISKASGKFKITDIDAIFKRNLPSNDLETSTIITNLDGKVSQETLIGQLSFVRDAKEEIKQAKKEAEERQKAVADLMAGGEIPTTQSTDPNAPNYVDPNEQPDEKDKPKPAVVPVKPVPVKKV